MDALGIYGKPKFRAQFNCRLICKQRVTPTTWSPSSLGSVPRRPANGGLGSSDADWMDWTMGHDQAHPGRSQTISQLGWSPGLFKTARRTQRDGPRGRWRTRPGYPRALLRGSGWHMACAYEAGEAAISLSSKWWARSCRFTGSANDTSHALRDNCARPRIWGRESEEGLPRVFRPPAANSVQLPAGRCGLRRESDLTLDVHPADAQRTASRRSRDGQSSAGVHRCLAPLLDGDLHLDDGRGSKGCRLETCPHRLA